MQLSVVNNAKRNMIFGFINKFVALICPFIARTAIQMILGSEYLGLSSLFTAILNVLSLSELGISGAIVYNMYKPVANNDKETVCALLNFYRKVYKIIGFVILVIGLCLIPFLPYLISGSYPSDTNIVILYLIYLSNTVISYFMFAYMSSLIVVYQRDDINSRTNTIVTLLMYGIQIAILFTTENYYLYLLIMPIFTIVNNLRVAFIVRKMFPEYKPKGKISKDVSADIKVRVSGAFITNVSMVTRNSLDSVCISMFLGLTLTAIYNNYYYIIAGLISILGIVSTSLQGGVGNHVAIRSVEENFTELKKVDFAYMWGSSWCTVCLICLYQPFMYLWMGESMMLDIPAVALLCFYFYILKMSDMRSIYSTTNGLWWHHRYRSMAEAAGNIVLNIVLGKFFGVYGIISATIITIFLLNFLWGTQITFKHYFGYKFVPQYLLYHFKYLTITACLCIVTYLCCSILPIQNKVVILLVRGVICIIIPNVIWIFLFHNTKEFSYMRSVILKRR